MSTRREFLIGTTAMTAAGAASAAIAEPMHGARQAGSRMGADYTSRLNAARTATGVTGASFAYWDGKALHTAVSGKRNSVTGDPITLDTVMHVGSITKITTAVLLMQLVDDGVIALEDPILRHLPQFRLRDMAAAKRITCAMLINHTSGIDGEWLPEYGPDQERIVDAVNRCADLGQLFVPGDATSYNNIATVVAGYLVQKLRSRSWYTLVKERIYAPLGMLHALVDPLEVPRFRASIGDLTDHATGRVVQTTRPFLATSFGPAGSTQMTTATDLVTFARALIGDGVGPNGVRIVSAASAQRMMMPTAEFVPVGGETEKIGLGWMIFPGGVVGHGGGGPGIRSQLFAHPASGRAMAILTNCDRGERLVAAFLEPIVRSWTGIAPTVPPKRIGFIDTTPYAGTYENVADRYVVTADKQGLALRTVDKIGTFDNSAQEGPAAILYPIGDDTFESQAGKNEKTLIRFVRPRADGKMRFLASWGRLLARTE